jgi:phosphate transport system protein
MVFEFFRSPGRSTIQEVEDKLAQMVRDGRAVYDAAMAAVFGGGASRAAKQEVKGTDREINVAQQEVRKALLIHASVAGTVDVPETLVYMSVVKDAERIGDYAKNIYDLAKYGVDFTTAPDREELERYRDNVGALIDEAVAVFESRDISRARELIAKADAFLDEYDDQVKAAFTSTGPASDAVARTLFYRFLKRITAHVMNLMTSIVFPIHRLDYYDEAREDRDQ